MKEVGLDVDFATCSEDNIFVLSLYDKSGGHHSYIITILLLIILFTFLLVCQDSRGETTPIHFA